MATCLCPKETRSSFINFLRSGEHDDEAVKAAAVAMRHSTKRHTVPSRTETGRQSGGRRPGLKLEVPVVGRDWMGLGLGSAGRRPGPGLARD